MKNKIALVTGGMGGIGTAICQHFHSLGAKVIATYNRKGKHEEAQAWKAAQKQAGYDIEIIFVDVTNFDSCLEMAKKIESDIGGVDILVNNAGITCDVPLCKMTVEQWHNVISTNLDGIFNITRNIIPGMINRRYGRIINMSSINGQKGQYGQTNYAAAKAGIHGFTKSLSQEVARKGITVNTISPGYIETNMVMCVTEAIRTKIIEQIPIGRLGQPQEIARACSFLAAEESSFITGSNLVINGGHYLI